MKKNKITIVGAGMVGSTTAYSLIAANLCEEIALIDLDKKMVRSQVMDLQHSVPFWGYTKIKMGNYEDLRDSKIVVIACGAAQKVNETRLDLVNKNALIIKNIIPRIFEENKDIIVIMVANPVDVLTYLAVSAFPKRKNQIIGSGTTLDSARFRFMLGEYLKVNPQSIHAYIVGEHGDSEVPLWSTISIGNTNIDAFKKIPASVKKKIFESAKNAAYAIIEGKQATYYAIAAGVSELSKAILFDKKTVFSVSHLIEGEYGIKNVCFSLPVVVGRKGIIRKIKIKVSAEEKKLLQKSAEKLKQVIKTL
jgi:L-lactate dehydrogenase